MSILTLLVFIFYTGDITADMTSGPSDIPIHNFEDVIYHNYKVVTMSPYHEYILASSKPGSAMLEVHNTQFEMKKDKDDVLNAMIQKADSKTLYYGPNAWLIKHSPETHKLVFVELDGSVTTIGGFALQKDSEFLQIFNHYILKAEEGGVYKRITDNAFLYLLARETFEMAEPQPLGYNNVMFCFISLGFGIFLSILKVMMEFILWRISKKQSVARTNERKAIRRWATRSNIKGVH